MASHSSPAAGPGPARTRAGTRGRPRVQETADEIVASVLATAGPRVSTPAYSTRRVAELTGLSQSVVARAFRRIRRGAPAAAPQPGRRAPEEPLELASLRVEHPQITLNFRPAPLGTTSQDGAPQSSSAPQSGAAPRPTPVAAARRSAAVLAALWVSDAGAWRRPSSQTAMPPSDMPSRPRYDAAELSVTWRPGAGGWEDFLFDVAALLGRCRTRDAIPGELLRLLASRAGRGLHGLSWPADDPRTAPRDQQNASISDSDPLAVSEFPAPGRSGRARWLPDDQLSVTEQIAITLRKEIMESGAAAGDRVGAQALADRLGLRVGTVRTAMGRLADDGLLARSERGFAVPWVTGADVIDLYAARLQTGAVLLRGCAAQPRHRLLPARLALGVLEAAAAQGTRRDVGQADLQFQQTLAESSGLGQSARSFHGLTLRVRMFISVLQLDYTPAVDRLVSDDRRILSALLAGEPDEAVRVWRAKLDHAVRHMSALAPESFDAALWNWLVPR